MSTPSATQEINLHQYRWPKIIIARFVARHTVRGALMWAAIFGAYVASKAIGFVKLYPTEAARQKIAATFSNNLGIQLLIGQAPRDSTTAAYVAWNCANIIVVFGAIWAFLTATKYFRGEEESGRSEVLLAGQTTARRAAINILSGIGLSLIAFFALISALLILVGRYNGVDYSTSAALFFAFVVTLGISLFMAIGALVSQLMPTRSRAAGTTGAILGIFFLIRAMGDVTSAHWLLNLTPLGWVEKAQPLARVQALWLIPFFVSLVIIVPLTISLAGKRDYGESIISDRAVTKPRFGLLHSPFTLAARLTRANNIGWLSAIFVSALIYGLISKSTGQIFSKSRSFEKAIGHLARQANLSSILEFLGLVFLIQMILIMAYSASSMAAIRRDEALGYIDNFLVQPFSRLRWLAGRLVIIGLMLVSAAVITTLGIWIGLYSQHTGISFHTILLASLNALVPAVLLISVGIFAFGIYPRLTSVMAYAVLAWSFLIALVGSGLNLNHWFLDTSILHQVTLAPTVSPNWPLNLTVVLIAAVLAGIGMLRFNSRDIEGE